MVLDNIYKEAFPSLKNRVIKEARIGLVLMAVVLDDGCAGVAYVLRNEIQYPCTVLENPGKLNGMAAEQMAGWAI